MLWEATDSEHARALLPKVKWPSVPEWTERDDWLLDLWGQMLSPLAAGAQFDLLRWACEEQGLTTLPQQREVWERIVSADSITRGYHAAVAQAQREMNGGS